ncbi:MAG: MltA domain-containing protein [Magnetococcales bacterium]|nr:MltA domain-containing protein [Magnetococcales bacterium]
MHVKFLIHIILLVFVAGCQSLPQQPEPAPPPPPPKVKSARVVGDVNATNSLEPIPWSEVPPALFQDSATRTWADALENSATYYRRVPADKLFNFGSQTVSAASLLKGCIELAKVARGEDMAQLKTLLQQRFRLFRSVGNSEGDVLVTGYYEPLLHGSFTRSKRYYYPIYRRPPDLVESSQGNYRLVKGKREKYYSREQIDGQILKQNFSKKQTGALANRGLELVWVDSAIDAFFLHIQGSGRVVLENGQVMRLGYHGANGRAYVPIGKILIEEGKIPKAEMTMPRLRQWLRDNPGENQRLFHANPSYVFFHELSGPPVGNINVPLTQDRSIATDHRLFPKGAPAILATTIPHFAQDGKTVTEWRPEARFVVNQDTGGAIRGAGRVDLFFGFGDKVEYQAGVMKQSDSTLYFIAPRIE